MSQPVTFSSKPLTQVTIEGLTEFRRGLKNLDDKLPRALRIAFNEAAQIVVDDARPKIPRVTGTAAASVRVQSTQGKAKIKAGGAKAPYYAWLDFGGRRAGRGGGIAVRRWYTSGRYIWHSFGEKRDKVVAAIDRGIGELARQSGLPVVSHA